MIKTRKTNLDILRALAAIAVAVYHVLGNSINSDPSVSAQLHSAINSLCDSMYWHVPVFYMITGYLWLSDSKECTYRKVLKNVRRFVLVLFTVGYGYAMLELLFVNRSLSLGMLLQGLANVLQGKLWDHMWYVYAIIGIYLLLPVLKPFFSHSDRKTIGLFTALLFVFTILLPALGNGLGFTASVTIPVASSLFYVCAGGLISKLDMAAIKKMSVGGGVLFLCSAAAAWIVQYFTAEGCWTSVFNSICAVGIFLCILGCFDKIGGVPAINSFADCSFGVYLFHQFFINLLFKLLHFYPLQHAPIISIPAVSVVVIALSYLTTYLLRKIPLIRKYIL